MGEEEAGSKRRSLMWGLIPEHRGHALSRRQTLNRCATQAPLYIYLNVLVQAGPGRGRQWGVGKQVEGDGERES